MGNPYKFKLQEFQNPARPRRCRPRSLRKSKEQSFELRSLDTRIFGDIPSEGVYGFDRNMQGLGLLKVKGILGHMAYS